MQNKIILIVMILGFSNCQYNKKPIENYQAIDSINANKFDIVDDSQFQIFINSDDYSTLSGRSVVLEKFEIGGLLSNLFKQVDSRISDTTFTNGSRYIEWKLNNDDFDFFSKRDTIFFNYDIPLCKGKKYYSHSDTLINYKIEANSVICSDVYSFVWIKNDLYIFILSKYSKSQSQIKEEYLKRGITYNFDSLNPNNCDYTNEKFNVFLGSIKIKVDKSNNTYKVVKFNPFITFLHSFNSEFSKILIYEKSNSDRNFLIVASERIPSNRYSEEVIEDPKEYYLLDTNLNYQYIGSCLDNIHIKENLWYSLKDSFLDKFYKLKYDVDGKLKHISLLENENIILDKPIPSLSESFKFIEGQVSYDVIENEIFQGLDIVENQRINGFLKTLDKYEKAILAQNIANLAKSKENRNIKKFQSDGQKCSYCSIGIYHNGSCTVCDAASYELKQMYVEKWTSNPKTNELIKCQVCDGNGCKTCRYKGYIIP